jgi:hypothetical protein
MHLRMEHLPYTLLVSDDATGKVERVLATTLIQGGVAEKC